MWRWGSFSVANPLSRSPFRTPQKGKGWRMAQLNQGDSRWFQICNLTIAMSPSFKIWIELAFWCNLTGAHMLEIGQSFWFPTQTTLSKVDDMWIFTCPANPQSRPKSFLWSIVRPFYLHQVWDQYIYILSSTLYIHYTYFTHTLYILYTYFIHTLYILYTYFIHTLHILWTYFIHTLYVLYTYFIHTLHILYTYFGHTLYILYTYIIHTLYILYTYFIHTLHILWTYFIHTLYVLYTYFIHTLHILWTYFIHTLYILYTYFIHTLYILWTYLDIL